MTTPSIGRTVIYRWNQSTNGADRHPAVITRVWGPAMVNLMVFFDAAVPRPETSVTLFNDEWEADEYIKQRLEHEGPSAAYRCAHFPTKV
jgi:hypothetical protein